MGSVRTAGTAGQQGFDGECAQTGRAAGPSRPDPGMEFPVLDIVYLVGVIALFWLIGAFGKGLEKL